MTIKMLLKQSLAVLISHTAHLSVAAEEGAGKTNKEVIVVRLHVIRVLVDGAADSVQHHKHCRSV